VEEEIGNLSDLEASSEEETVGRGGEGRGAAGGAEQEEAEQHVGGPPMANACAGAGAGSEEATRGQQQRQELPIDRRPDRKRERTDAEAERVVEREAEGLGEHGMDTAAVEVVSETAAAAEAATDRIAGLRVDRKRHRALLAAEAGGWRQIGVQAAARKRKPEGELDTDGQTGKVGRLADEEDESAAANVEVRGVKRTAEGTAAAPARAGPTSSSSEATIAEAQPGSVRRRLTGKQSVTRASGSAEATGTEAAEGRKMPSIRQFDGVGSQDNASSAANPLAQHQLRLTGPMVWCARCGHHALQRVRGLGEACAGRPEGVYAVRLRRLLEGRHPITDKPMETSI
jgi:hypothetical protein